jgi:hypothetical protein
LSPSHSSRIIELDVMSQDRIRVLVVEPHPVVRSGIVSVLDRRCDAEVVGEAADDNAVERCLALLPDVVLLDAGIAGPGRGDLLAAIPSSHSLVRILLLCALPQGWPSCCPLVLEGSRCGRTYPGAPTPYTLNSGATYCDFLAMFNAAGKPQPRRDEL